MSTDALLKTEYEYLEEPPPAVDFPPPHRDDFKNNRSLPAIMPRRKAAALWAKRTLDVMVACAALTLLAPFMILIAIAVLMDSPGSVLYRTYRVGKHGLPFPFYKFRTMV